MGKLRGYADKIRKNIDIFGYKPSLTSYEGMRYTTYLGKK
jgi:hypothetical protein